MEPVIKTQTAYSVLFMRDDCGVKRFRMRACWLKIFVLFGLLVFSVAVGSSWGAYYFWNKFRVVRAEYHSAAEELVGIRQKLTSLQNMEKIRNENDPAHTRTMLERVPSENGAAKFPMVLALNATASQVAPANATIPSHAEADPTPDFEHPARITKITAIAVGATRIRFIFDVTNQNQNQQLTGRVQLAAITAGGAVVDLAGADRDSLRFQISRLKNITTTAPLPQDLPLASVQGVQITVDAEGLPLYVERFPFPIQQQ